MEGNVSELLTPEGRLASLAQMYDVDTTIIADLANQLVALKRTNAQLAERLDGLEIISSNLGDRVVEQERELEAKDRQLALAKALVEARDRNLERVEYRVNNLQHALDGALLYMSQGLWDTIVAGIAADVDSTIEDGRKIEAIKAVRAGLNCGLYLAKVLVEARQKHLDSLS